MTEQSILPPDFKAKLEEKVTVEEFKEIIENAFVEDRNIKSGVYSQPDIFDPVKREWYKKG
ncbi:hypothetical protein [uncultured Methanomethylovorans sp.]|uniref:hypothetical protein n=1 Tax=uncultured Methanomethylovorans sp. TaxID=183759 RepID=UPI00262B3F46|nr:hypothetical protein [uncultured Methanomethylovorans sp.]